MMSYLVKPNEQLHFDGSDMLMMHDMFRREFALMPGLVGGVAAGDHDRAQIIGDHIEGVSTVLHHHHVGEDGNIWPLLLDRCGESVAPLVGLMEDQHQRVATLVGEVDEVLTIWRGSATIESREALVEALNRLIPALKEHLSAEEDRVVPLMEQHITAAEWDETFKKESAHVDPEQLPLVFGMLMYEGDPESIEHTIVTLPAETRTVIKQLAASTFADHSQRVHGSATPPRSTEL
jgi:hemerythrin-like domain-containing protein